MILTLFISLMINYSDRNELSHKWKGFCERNLIADDPNDELTQKLKKEEEDRK